MLLHGVSAWSLSSSPRLERKLSFIQRITGSYRTTPTSASQVIIGFMPQHLKAQQEALYINITGLKKEIEFEGVTYYPREFEE
ncbi:hypothetical protein HNY73_008091 [Argiope bruennichi]|uniref:Uncharacterized protein n=1 Tax=Argiope bruennichi TaxID=94029 RepID=A0A8T0FAH7_ARGBR|nr:hypothetical protein HNY73_008091 [Argiope bruennichi]